MALLTRQHVQARPLTSACPSVAQSIRQRCRTHAATTAQAQGQEARLVTQPRTLVVALDHNEGSCRAVKWTIEHLFRPGDVLHLLHVVPMVPSMVTTSGFSLAATMPAEEGEQEQLAAHAQSYMAYLADTAAEAGATCEMDLVVGRCNTSVSDTICSKVDELEASVVVLSVQPTSFLEGWLYPPISKQVAEKCTRPTLIFHG